MGGSYDKILEATFSREDGELTWVQAFDFDSGEPPVSYQIWLLVQKGTDRVVATIDGPSLKQFCYSVASQGSSSRHFISLEGAKTYAVSLAKSILVEERKDSAKRRHARRAERTKK